MDKNAHAMLTAIACEIEKLASGIESDFRTASQKLPPDISDHDRGWFSGYIEGQVKASREIAEHIRKVLRESPPSVSLRPRISLGFIWPFDSN